MAGPVMAPRDRYTIAARLAQDHCQIAASLQDCCNSRHTIAAAALSLGHSAEVADLRAADFWAIECKELPRGRSRLTLQANLEPS
ncbi:MAG: hypothetical protein VKK80_08010 [Prochlorothrix sp.]|nr:hypothetical protein [Prochlorothrix sp.]